jgi:SanA protein
MFKRILKLFIRILFYLAISAAALVLAARLLLLLYARPMIQSTAQSAGSKVAIVFGAGLYHDGQPTPVLRDRVATAADLYFSGKVEKLLMSGDNRFVDYNEPGAMRAYAMQLGVPDSAIVLDYAGRRTYDTCFRASAIFGVKEAVLVTQQFHLARALFTCNFLGVKATGVTADRQTYTRASRVNWQVREIPASFVAIWDVFITHPLPVLGNPEPIFPDAIHTAAIFTPKDELK